MKIQIFIICAILCLSLAQDYQNQKTWDLQCQIGKYQSPININTESVRFCSANQIFKIYSIDQDYDQPAYNYKNENIKTPFTLSTIKFNQGGVQKTYEAKQFHFHHPSEHLINSQLFDAQVHFVHQSQDGDYAVYGILFKVFADTQLDPFDEWNLNTEETVTQKLPINLTTPEIVFNYPGSLTTPPCSENVQWFVNPVPIRIKQSSLDVLTGIINEGKPNERDTQPLFERPIFIEGQVCKHVSNSHKIARHNLKGLFSHHSTK